MSGSTYGYTILVNNLASGPLGKIAADLETTGSKFRALAGDVVKLNAIQQVAERTASAIQGLTAPAIAFERGLSELKAITNATDEQMAAMRASALRLAPALGIKATDSVNAFNVGLSELGPELATNAQALEMYGRNVGILSKQMKGDQAGAAGILNAAMLQYGNNLADPIARTQEMTRFMHLLSASGTEGAANMTSLKDTFIKAAPAAKIAGTGIEDFVAAAQAVAKGGLKGAEAGTAMSAVFMRMATVGGLPAKVQASLKAAGVNMDVVTSKTAPLAAKLEEIGKIRGNANLMADVFGSDAGNTAAIAAMLNNMDMIKVGAGGLRDKIVGTTDADRQFNIIANDTQGRLERQAAAWEVLKIKVGGALTQFAPMLQSLSSGVVIGTQLAPAIGWMGTAAAASGKWMKGLAVDLWNNTRAAWANRTAHLFTAQVMLTMARTRIVSFLASLSGALGMATVKQWLLNVAMSANPIGVVIAALAALGVVVYAVVKHWDFLKAYATKFVGYLWNLFLYSNPLGWMILGVQKLMEMFPAFGAAVNKVWKSIGDTFMAMWEGIKKGVAFVADLLGVGGDVNITADPGKIDAAAGTAGAPGAPAGTPPGGNGAATGMANTIAGGGSKPSVFHITLNNAITVHSQTLKEGARQVEAEFSELFLRVINGAAMQQ